MDAFNNPISENVINCAISQIVTQVDYLIKYRDNFKELDDKINELQKVREMIQHKIEEEERSYGNQREGYVQDWIYQVNKLIQEAKKLVEDPRHVAVRCQQWSCPDLRSRRILSKMAKEMVENVKTCTEEVRNFMSVTWNTKTCYLESTPRALAFQSREPMFKKMMEALKDPKKIRIGVYGLGGVGKTTLAEQVAKEAKENSLFDAVVKGRVGENPQLEKIQDDIAELLDMKLDEKSVIKRAYLIRKRIEREKSVLIILDDVRTTINLEDVGIPEPNTINLEDRGVSTTTAYNLERGRTLSKGNNVACKILMTSRSQDLLLEMGSEINFRVELLSKEEAWNLFKAKAGPKMVEDHSLRQIATHVAEKCGGLPIIITAMATTLKNRSVHDWKAALRKLERAGSSKELNDIIYSALELNYNWLESNEVKKLFLLCGVEGYSFGDLLKYGIGLGIFKDIITMEDARLNLYKMICSLKASCLLLEDKSMEFITMHDTVCEVAMSIASRNQYFFTKREDTDLKEWPVDDLLQRCPLIILHGHCISELPERLECPKLDFLYLDGGQNHSFNIPDSFFEGAGNLKVLDLKGMIMSSLPTSLSSLTKLKTLCLDRCLFEDMARIGALKNLEILSLIKSSMTQLPSEIRELTNLKMLDLSNSGIGVIPPKIISNLIKLEELYVGNSAIKWEVEDSTKQNENASIAELRPLTNLTAFEIQIQDARMLPKDLKFDKLAKYKIIVGDIWDWFEEHETSKTLKLKLGFDVDLVQWVKALIKTVENLYLDEIDDISIVLHQLSERRSSPLKHLHIQNNTKIQHIISMTERRNQAYVSFPNLEILSLKNLNNFETICHGPVMMNSFNKLRVIKVKSCDQLKYLLLVSIVEALSQLIEMEVFECNSMKKIVLMENEDNDITIDKIEFTSLRSLTLQHLPILDDFCSSELMSSTTEQKFKLQRIKIPTSFFDAKIALPNLETLKLSSINIKKIWDDDQLSVVALSLHNLANLIVEDCGGLKYLFSSSLVECFSNLKQLEISQCDMMEEIITTQRENNGVALAEVGFAKLEKITIKNMKNLKAVWHYQFEGLKMLEVENCKKIGHIFPSHMQRTYGSVETLIISECNSMEEIFVVSDNEEQMGQHTTHLKELSLFELPKLKRIWTKDPQRSSCFHNLQNVWVDDCPTLEFLFPFSVAIDLPQLEELMVFSCSMNEIVSKKEGLSLERDTTVQFEFSHLTNLGLWNVRKLKRFYAGNHSLACPSLSALSVFKCDKLKIFKTQYSSSQGRIYDSKLHVSMQQPLFNVEQVICNLDTLMVNTEVASTLLQSQLSRDHFCKLKDLRVVEFEDDEATFPYWLLQNTSSFERLERLCVIYSSFKEIFNYEKLKDEKGDIAISKRLKYLLLHGLHKLEHISKEESQIDPVLDLLETLFVAQCSSLVILVPSHVTFNHLLYLDVENCNKLVNLITSSTARSMVILREMKIRECNLLEQIINEEGDQVNEDIVFSSLIILELECLPRLNMFCSAKCLLKFPLLEKVVVRQCPRMKIFSATTSTPMLHKVLVEENNKEWCWNDDLNLTIKKMFMDKVGFRSFMHLELSDYPELKGLWNDQVYNKVFSNLKSMVVQKCDFLLDALLSPKLLQELSNLEDLDVRDCDSLEVVFDLSGMEEKGREVINRSIKLNKIILSNLPKLKHIWNLGSQEIVNFEEIEEGEVDLQRQRPLFSNEKTWNQDSRRLKLNFRNLQVVKVAACQNLVHLFSVLQSQDLGQLEELDIEECGIEEIVAIEAGSPELRFYFPQLTILRLMSLPKLKNFYPGKHIIECPSLRTLNVYLCEALRVFCFDNLKSQQITPSVDAIEMPTQQALFYVEKLVSPNLEELALSEMEAMRILNGHYDGNRFLSLQILRLQYFQETPMKFLYYFLERIPNTKTLQLRCSSFETLFPSKGIGLHRTKSHTPIRVLWLLQLEQLKHIWDDDSVTDPLVQNLEGLSIIKCSHLIRLAPPYISFKNLTTLKVEDCKGLIYLMTISTAKSLVQLTSLTIKNCEMVENVVMFDEEESEEEITFENLEDLQLISLSCFKSFYSGKHTLIFPSFIELIIQECSKMQNFSSGHVIAPMLRTVEVEDGEKHLKEDLNTTIRQLIMDKERISKATEGNNESSSSIFDSPPRQRTTSTIGALGSEKHATQSKHEHIVYTTKHEIHMTRVQGEAIENQETCEVAKKPLVQATSKTKSPTTIKDEVIKPQEMHEATERSLVLVSQSTMSPTTIQDGGSSGPVIKAQETPETIERSLILVTNNEESPPTIQDTDFRSSAIEATERSLVLASQMNPTTIQDAEGSHDRETQNSLNQSTTSKTTKTVDPHFPQVPEATILSFLAYDAYKDMLDISAQNLPYLEAGVKRHPQVLDWLNKKQLRRAFASSFFSLFADVTRLLRTIRRGCLSEDDRNYITECCSSLEGVGFDASWLSYVKGCIEECDNGEKLKRTIEETEGKASILKAQLESIKKDLASVEGSLVLLHHKANRLDDFIES